MSDPQKSTSLKTLIKVASKFDFLLIREIEKELNLNITSEEHYKKLIDYHKSYILKLIFQNQIVGFIQVQGDILECEILSIGVKKKFQKLGFGKSMIFYFIHLGYQKIILEVSMNNFEAINFYFSLGFKIISIRKKYYNAQSKAIDAYILKFESLQ